MKRRLLTLCLMPLATLSLAHTQTPANLISQCQPVVNIAAADKLAKRGLITPEFSLQRNMNINGVRCHTQSNPMLVSASTQRTDLFQWATQQGFVNAPEAAQLTKVQY